ncbi:MAG TPA: hypothetical protein VIU61_10880, partial [Kofleriaceae bacterium]
AEVVAPTFALHTQDAAPSDGLLDFGTVPVSQAPVLRTVTVQNTSNEVLQIVDCWAPAAPFGMVPERPCATTIDLPPSGTHAITVSLDARTKGDFFEVGQIGIVPASGGLVSWIAVAAHARVGRSRTGLTELESGIETETESEPSTGGCQSGRDATPLVALVVCGLFIARRRRCDGASRQRN